MKNKYSPGCWVARFFPDLDPEVAEAAKKAGITMPRILMNDGSMPVMDGEGNRVCLVDCKTQFKRGEGSKAECATRDANAVLIANAPALHYTLKQLMDALPDNRDWLDPTLEKMARELLKSLNDHLTEGEEQE